MTWSGAIDADPDVLEQVSERYHRFAAEECGTYAPLYAALARSVAEDRSMLEFVARMPDVQPNLLLASVQFLTGPAEMPSSGPRLARFLEDHGEEVGHLMRSRHTQTNEIGRCALLLPALPPGPLALVEIGASAGLCLMFDRYRYDYGGSRVGDPTSPAVIRCEPIGPASIPIPERMPDVVWRKGIDLHPVDLTTPDNVRWLSACVWSDHPQRRDRLEAAVRIALPNPPEVVRGDLLENLPQLLQGAPAAGALVVFHAAVWPYVEEEQRNRFEEALADYAETARKIVLISIEGPGAVPWLDELVPKRGSLQFRIGRTVFSGESIQRELLGLGHPHGWDLEWLVSPAPFAEQS